MRTNGKVREDREDSVEQDPVVGFLSVDYSK